jgi:hypothetical protein
MKIISSLEPVKQTCFANLPVGTMFVYGSEPTWVSKPSGDNTVYVKLNQESEGNVLHIPLDGTDQRISHFNSQNKWYFFEVKPHVNTTFEIVNILE